MNNEVLKPTEQNPQGYGPSKPEILNLARKAQVLNRVKVTMNGAYVDNVPMG
ncbi:MAG: hypothetical protein IJW40_11910 [Clostridia bacterium]|nr:hypothetical protein [Clostridia bacterium]MBQ7339139.1 hypothetical protein [Clostridia bacterium]